MKKTLAMVLTIVMVLGVTIPTFASNEKVTNQYGVGAEYKQDFNNAQFHCNANNGNGRVWPIEPTDMKKFAGSLTFTKGEGTTWKLTGVADKNGPCTMVVCPECGSIEWVTFSNNSGVPDGKNVQMCHPAKVEEPIEFSIKIYHKDADGNLIDFPANFPDGELFDMDSILYLQRINAGEYVGVDEGAYIFVNLWKVAYERDGMLEIVPKELADKYTCTRVEADGDIAAFNLVVNGTGNDTVALLTPKASGDYVITFWYDTPVEPTTLRQYLELGELLRTIYEAHSDIQYLVDPFYVEHAQALREKYGEQLPWFGFDKVEGATALGGSGYKYPDTFDAELEALWTYWADRHDTVLQSVFEALDNNGIDINNYLTIYKEIWGI